MSPSRIDELRRRVQNDPASIAFAQLAEEYRRSGQTDEAVRVCREGLTRHPGYLSARVTLGRALLDLGQLADAQAELEFVVAEAPENLAAVRGLAEICQRGGNFPEALNYYRRALTLARHDPEIEEIVQQLSRQVGVAAAGSSQGLSFEEAHRELLSAAERVPVAAPTPHGEPATAAPAAGATAPFDFDRLVAALGSPAAPAPVEAVVQGRAPAPPVELPEALEDPSNPFAALEAELRAQDAATPPTSAPAFAEAEPSSMAAWPAPLDDAGAVSATPLQLLDAAPTPLAVEHVDLGQALAAAAGDDVQTDAAPATIGPDWSGLLTLSDGDGRSSVPSEAASDGRPVENAAQEDVLGDLEHWLDTLHDRTNP